MDEVRRQMAARYAAAKAEDKPKLRICGDCQQPVYDSKVCSETGLYHDREKMRIVGGQVTEVDTRVFSGRDLISAIDAARVKWQAARTRKVRIDATAVTIFQTFVLQHQWRLQRCGILYGDYDAVSGTITAHCIYEPEQEGDEMFFKLLPDAREKRVDAIAHALGLRRVGIILTHPPRDAEEIVLTAGELLLLAREQSRFGDECVLLTVAPDPATHQIAAQAWQASEQCVRLFRMGVLSRDEHPGMVRSTIPLELAQDVRDEKGHQKCVVRQPSDTIDARWMTAYCAVESFDSTVTQNKFVRISRPGEAPPDFPNLRAYLSDPKRNRLPFWQQVNDFHVLIFLAEKLLPRDADLVALVTAVKNGDAAGAAKFEEMVKARVKA